MIKSEINEIENGKIEKKSTKVKVFWRQNWQDYSYTKRKKQIEKFQIIILEMKREQIIQLIPQKSKRLEGTFVFVSFVLWKVEHFISKKT